MPFTRRTFLASLSLIAASFSHAAAPEPTKKDIVFAEVDGEALTLDAYVPDGPGPFPVCVLVHGGGWTKGDKNTFITPLFEPLRSAGFTVFSINYRLAPKYIFPACADDVDTAIRWARTHAAEFKGDPARLALVGESAGGYLVAHAGARSKERVSAVVAFYAPTDLESRVRASNKLDTAGALLGLKTIDDAAWKTLHDASPINHVHAQMPPFYLIHGTKDARVPHEQSVLFQKKMQAAGNVCDLLTIEDGAHGMSTWDKLGREYRAPLVQWLKSTLK